VGHINTEESSICRSGEVLQGFIKPHECAAFGKECTPRNPLGATMVSSEGACAAYYLYRRLDTPRAGPVSVEITEREASVV
jgi:hydrogenase expression/formation protein HypD